MVSKKLQRARDYEKKHMASVADEQPKFHVAGGIGWINDPNGVSCYQGEYHLFYQYHPYDVKWGPMHWGHVKTKDFIRWERLPVAMAPDMEYDKHGCFSGSAVETPDGRHLLMYTGVLHDRKKKKEYQTQCMAVGDGVHYEKYKGNPVLTGADVPDGGSFSDFRDPKLWYDEELKKYFVVVGNRAADTSGRALLYESEDGFHWSFRTVLDESRNQIGKMWECPDFFAVDGKHVLMISPMEVRAQGLEFHPGHNTVAIIGDYDKYNAKFTREHVQAVDYGIDFYAMQSLETYDGRRVMIGWMQSWGTCNNIERYSKWFGQMNLPREVNVVNGRLIQNPVRELENYRTQRTVHENVSVAEEMTLPGVSGRVLDMIVTLRPEEDFRSFTMKVAKNEMYETSVHYDGSKQIITIDRTFSGMNQDMVQSRSFYVTPKDGGLKLRCVMDRNCLEVFVNDGEQAASFMLYTPEQAEGITFAAEGNVKMNVEKYNLEV